MAIVKTFNTVNEINVYNEGRPGPNGLSAYDVWISQGNSGSIADFLDSLTGPAGSGSTEIPDGTISGSSQVIFSQISNIPSGIYSSSLQETDPIFISKSGSFVLTASYRFDSGSWNDKILIIDQATSSFALKTEISGAFQTNGLISSSAQINYNLIQNQPTSILSASFALTASYISGSNSISSSYSLTSSFSTNIQTIGIRIKTFDSFIEAGSKGFRHIGYNSNIIKISAISNIEGNIDLNIKRNNSLLGNFNLTNQSSSIDSTLTSWTTQLNTDDFVEFVVSGNSTYITDLTFFMDIQNR